MYPAQGYGRNAGRAAPIEAYHRSRKKDDIVMDDLKQTTPADVRAIIAAAWAGKPTLKPPTPMTVRRHARQVAAADAVGPA